MLAELMLSNLYVIPHLLGQPPPADTGWASSNFATEEYIDEIPHEVLAAITEDDRKWMGYLHNSMEFRRYRKRHIEIFRQLERTREVEKRIPLVREAEALLDELRQGCS